MTALSSIPELPRLFAGAKRYFRPWALVAGIVFLIGTATTVRLAFSFEGEKQATTGAGLRHIISLCRTQLDPILQNHVHKSGNVPFDAVYTLVSRMIFHEKNGPNQVILFNRNGVILSMPLAPQLEGSNIFRLHDKNLVSLYRSLALSATGNREGALCTVPLTTEGKHPAGELLGFAIRIPELNAFMVAVSHIPVSPAGMVPDLVKDALLVLIACLIGAGLTRLAMRRPFPGHGIGSSSTPTESKVIESLLEYSNNAVVVVQNDLIIALNVPFAHLLGKHRHQLAQTLFQTYVHPDDAPAAATLAADLTNRSVRRAELRITGTTGEFIPMQCTAAPLPWKGEAAGLIWLEPANHSALSAESTAQTSVDLFINRLPMGLAVFSTAGKLETANREWLIHWNSLAPEEETFNIYDSALMHNPSLTGALAQAFSGRDGILHAYEFTAAQGEQRWLQVIFRALSTEGEITGVCMLQTDITVQVRGHKHEQELSRELEEKKGELTQALEHFQNLVDANPATIIGVDKGGLIRTWNRAAEKRFDLLRNRAVGQPLAGVSRILARHEPLITKALKEKAVQHAGRVPSFNNGTGRYEDITVYPFSSHQSEGAFVSIEDVTMRIRREEQHAQQEKLSSISLFAAGLAHEMNNPLGVILHAAQNLHRRLMHPLPANEKVALETGLDFNAITAYMQLRGIPAILTQMEEAGRRSAGLVSSLVRFGSGVNSPLVPTNVNALLERCVQLALSAPKPATGNHVAPIVMVLELQEGLPPALCAPDELEQAIVQIISNAVTSLRRSPPTLEPSITISTTASVDEVHIVVKDNGEGMTQEVQKRVFDPFFTTADKSEQGVGLGLALAYFIVATLHRGSLRCESAPGAGAAFSLTLLRASKNIAPKDTPPAKRPTGRS